MARLVKECGEIDTWQLALWVLAEPTASVVCVPVLSFEQKPVFHSRECIMHKSIVVVTLIVSLA